MKPIMEEYEKGYKEFYACAFRIEKIINNLTNNVVYG